MINIIGSGKIDTVISGSSATYTAIPSDGYTFKSYSYGDISTTDNPLMINSNIDVSVTFYMTISDSLKGLVGFVIPELNLNSILKKRNISPTENIDDLEFSTKELLYADVLIWGSTNYSSYKGASDSDGGWSHTDGTNTINAADKKRFESIAYEIYNTYGEYKKRKSIRIARLGNG